MSESTASNAVENVYEELHDTLVEAGREHGHWGLRHGYHDGECSDETTATERMREVMRDRTEISSNDHVLDIGCGFGTSSIWLAETVGASVTGTNIVTEQLTIARELAERRGVSDAVEFIRDDFHEMDAIADSSIDVVWACEALCYAHDLDRVLEEIDRVLTEDGRIIIADLFRAGEVGASCEHVDAFENCWESTIAHRSELLDSISDRGFDVTAFDSTAYVRPTVQRRYQRGLNMRPIARFRYRLGRCSEREIDYACGPIHEYRAIERGTLKYVIVSCKREI